MSSYIQRVGNLLAPSWHVSGEYDYCDFEVDTTRAGCRRASVDSAEPKTVQSNLRHAKIQTTPDLYTQEDSDETRAVQGEFLTAVGMNGIVR